MKKYLLLFIVSTVTMNCIGQAASGQLKIRIESFKCINKSWDGFVEFDGHGNEVFINYGYRIANPANPGTAKAGSGSTAIFGSGINGMIKSGTADRNLGGIDNGNEVAVNILALDVHVDADDIILFSPSVWEWDNSNNTLLNQFNTQLATDLNWATSQAYPFANATFSSTGPFNGRFEKTTTKLPAYFPIIKYNFMLPVVNVQENRPVGIRAGAFQGSNFALYDPAILFLDTKVLNSFYNYNKDVASINHPERPRRISGIVEFTFTENTYAITTSNGSYILRLGISFTPDVQTPASSPVPPAPQYSQLPKQPVISTISTPAPHTIASPVAGKWKGSYGNGVDEAGNYYAFQLNNDYTMQVLNDRDIVVANGKYSFKNNILSGTYSYAGGGTPISFSGTVFKTSVSGTWGLGNSTTGGGRWIMGKY